APKTSRIDRVLAALVRRRRDELALQDDPGPRDEQRRGAVRNLVQPPRWWMPPDEYAVEEVSERDARVRVARDGGFRERPADRQVLVFQPLQEPDVVVKLGAVIEQAFEVPPGAPRRAVRVGVGVQPPSHRGELRAVGEVLQLACGLA